MNEILDPSKLPYRPCVGIMLINQTGKIWVGRRLDAEESGYLNAWQMPQGGIDKGEMPLQAAFRELFEETSVKSARLLREAQDWYTYDLPDELVGKALKGKYKGQRQRWFLFDFYGEDSEVDIEHENNQVAREFAEWKWVSQEALPDLAVSFKRDIYVALLRVFASEFELRKEKLK